MEGRGWATALAELRYLDQEAAASYEEAVGGFPQDSETARELHRFRAAHARHAAEIDDVFFQHGSGPDELPEEQRSLLQEQVWHVTQARGRPGELEALLEAEEQHLQRYERLSLEQMPGEAARAVRDGAAEEREHVEALRRLVDSARSQRSR